MNDGATPFAITTLLAAATALDRPDLLTRARRGGDWLVAVQGAEPRAGWAQQYTAAGAPAGARAFEVPALATWETRHAIEALLALAEVTGERAYCASALRAARWLDTIRVGAACWARFVDPADGRAIFVDEAGARVATSAKARPGYSWMGDFGIPWVLRETGVERNNAPYRVPGDPGRCPEDPAPSRPLAGPRALAAEAGARFMDVHATSRCAAESR